MYQQYLRGAGLSKQSVTGWNEIYSFCFSHRHFLFKQGSGSSALLSGAGQGYPLTSGTVYSPPPRPLPRSSVTRPLFTFNKPHRCCNWKCTALSASLLTLTLALLLTYVIGELQYTPTTEPSSLSRGAAQEDLILFNFFQNGRLEEPGNWEACQETA